MRTKNVIGNGGLSTAALASLKLWLRADIGTTSSDDRVSAWADQSGNGNTCTASGTDRPTIITGQGGNRSLQFAPFQSLASAGNVVPSGSARTIFLIIRNSRTAYPFQFRQTGPLFACAWYQTSSPGVAAVYTDAVSKGKVSRVADVTAPAIYELTWDGNITGSVSFTLNGSVLAVSDTLAPGVTSDTGGAGYMIGSFGWSGEISEIAIFDTVLSDRDRLIFRSASSTRYQMPLV